MHDLYCLYFHHRASYNLRDYVPHWYPLTLFSHSVLIPPVPIMSGHGDINMEERWVIILLVFASFAKFAFHSGEDDVFKRLMQLKAMYKMQQQELTGVSHLLRKRSQRGGALRSSTIPCLSFSLLTHCRSPSLRPIAVDQEAAIMIQHHKRNRNNCSNHNNNSHHRSSSSHNSHNSHSQLHLASNQEKRVYLNCPSYKVRSWSV